MIYVGEIIVDVLKDVCFEECAISPGFYVLNLISPLVEMLGVDLYHIGIPFLSIRLVGMNLYVGTVG